MQFSKLKKFKAAEKRNELKRLAETYEIFVAGPYIDINQPGEAPVNAENIGKQIRFEVVKHYNELGHNVYLGEDVELRNIGDKQYGRKNNAVLFEREYIKESIGSLIVFPYGPGVFCELGDWATGKDISEKMLVLLSKEFEGNKSYISEGTAKAAASFGATVMYVDYGNLNDVISICDEFVEGRAIDDRVERLYGR